MRPDRLQAGSYISNQLFSFERSFLISGLTAEQPSLLQPDDFFFPNHERSSSVAAMETMARAMMVWKEGLMKR